MPAQRRKHRRKQLGRQFSKTKLLLVLGIIIFLIGAIFISSADFWNNSSKLTILVQKTDGDLNLIVFDPIVDEITSIIIPSNTEVEVAQHFGLFRIGNVWELGFSEGLGGSLLTKTVTKNFKFPVFIWAENNASGLASTNYLELARAVLSRYETNLSFGDRLRVAAFSLAVPHSRRLEIKLSESPYLNKTQLVDGKEGYLIEKNIPASILSHFADHVITRGEYRVAITNNTDKPQTASQVGEIVGVLGAKVASVNKGESEVEGCMVSGIDMKSVEIIANIFGCKGGLSKVDMKFDIEIVLGNNFDEIF